MSKLPGPKPYWKMDVSELAQATAEFEEEFSAETFGDPSPELQRLWQRTACDARWSTRHEDITVVRIGVEASLLAEVDRLAATRGLTRATLMARGLRAMLAVDGEE